MLPSGMIWLAIVCAWILAAICWICSGVSNITPAGAALNRGLVGLAEWHTVQRSSITLLTLLNWLWLSALFCCSLMLRSEEHTSELQSRENLVCRLLLENKKK